LFTWLPRNGSQTHWCNEVECATAKVMVGNRCRAVGLRAMQVDESQQQTSIGSLSG